jgi:predicted Rossmann fold nucleotide-binding protein DprA/Smf involved in DNA uptake
MCAVRPMDRIYVPRPYLVRNRDIVDVCNLLLATPGGTVEQLRSGTWATIRYARRIGRPVWIVFPNGEVRKEGGQ